MPDTIRLYYGRNSDEMVHRIQEYQSTDPDNPISLLEVRETVLDDVVMEAIVQLIQSRGVDTIQFDDCGAYASCFSLQIAQALGSVPNVRLTAPTFLSHYFLDTMLESATKLTNLRIQDHFDCQQMEALAKGLKGNTTLQVLDLSRSRMESLAILAEGLQENKTLKVLKLRSLGFNDESIHVLIDAIKYHPQLEDLDLSFNHCASLDSLAELVNDPSCRLSKLSLGYQNLWQSSRIDITAFARALRRNKSITAMSLARNKLVDSDILLLATALACNNTVQVLDLRENMLSDEGIAILANTIQHGTGIRIINLAQNPFQETGASSLLKAVETNHKLVDVHVNETTYKCSEIRYQTALNKAGRQLLFQSPPLGLWPLVLERINRLEFSDKQTFIASNGSTLEGNATFTRVDVLHFMVWSSNFLQHALSL
jgi:hypothetical protein